jgi:glucokinase
MPRTEDAARTTPGDREVLSLDIGGTKTTAARVRISSDRSAAEVVAEETVPTPAAAGAAAVLEAALEVGERVLAPGPSPAAVGISTAGVVDVASGTITHATSSLPGWPGTPVARTFAERFGVPARAMNDVHAHGLGEALFGVGREASSLLLVAVGTGIGGAQVIDGAPVLGARGAAGHVGHVSVPEAHGVPCTCGRTGHLEGLASGPGILGLAARLGAPSDQCADGRALAAAALAQEGPAREAYRVAGTATGRAIGFLLNVLDVRTVALAGGVVGASTVWDDALRAGLAREAMDVVADTPVVPAQAGSRAALLGAAAWATG